MISVVTNISDQLYVMAGRHGNIQEALGGEGVGKDLRDAVQAERRERTVAQIDARRVRGPDGAVRCYEGVVKDITDRRGAEEALRESEERYRIAIENSNDGICISDGDVQFFVNRRFVEMFGYDSADEVVKKSPSEMCHPDDRLMVEDIRRRRKEGSSPDRFRFIGHQEGWNAARCRGLGIEVLLPGRKGEPCLRERYHGAQAGGAGFTKEQATLRSVFSAAPVGIVITDTRRCPNGRTIAMTSITGYTFEEQQDRGARIFYASEEEFARVGKVMVEGVERDGIGITDTKWSIRTEK